MDVLIVDDDRATRDLLSLQAEEGPSAIRVVTAKDGEEALDRMMQGTRISMILLDLGMPHLDGFGFLFCLRRAFGRHAPPVVVVTARDLSPDDQLRLRSYGVVQVLQKGRYDTQGLVDIINVWAA